MGMNLGGIWVDLKNQGHWSKVKVTMSKKRDFQGLFIVHLTGVVDVKGHKGRGYHIKNVF